MGGYGLSALLLPWHPMQAANGLADHVRCHDRRGVKSRLRGSRAARHEEAHRIFIDSAHGIRPPWACLGFRSWRTPGRTSGIEVRLDGARVQWFPWMYPRACSVRGWDDRGTAGNPRYAASSIPCRIASSWVVFALANSGCRNFGFVGEFCSYGVS